MGPCIEQLRDIDDKGRFRSTYLAFPSYLITHTLVTLHALTDDRQRRSWVTNYDRLTSLTDQIEAIVREDFRPVDRILDDRLAYTDHDFWRKNHCRWVPAYPHRILLDAHITKVGDLSVRFSPQCLDEAGQWTHAPEWRQLPLSETVEPMKRPDGEVLFIRNVDWLLADNLARWNRYLGDVDRAELVFAAAACYAVNMAFWLVVHRLSNRFEVHLGRYVAKLSSTPDESDCLGLDIVDALAEHRESVQSAFETFEEVTGHTPRRFREVCEAADGNYVRASKTLRGHSGASWKLTPSIVKDCHDRLVMAERYGFWQPELPGEETAAESAAEHESEPDAVIPKFLNTPRPEIPAAEEHKRLDPPDYSRLRRYAATPEELAAAGTATVDELVERLNAHVGRGLSHPVTQADFPNSKRNFARLADLLAKLEAGTSGASGATRGTLLQPA
jgi:hypothetical protein